MALQTSGQIAMSDICVELGLDPTTNIGLDDSRCRKLAEKETANSQIGMGDFYGKSNFEYKLFRTVGAMEFIPPNSQTNVHWPAFGMAKSALRIEAMEGFLAYGVNGYKSDGSLLFSAKRGAPNGAWHVGDANAGASPSAVATVDNKIYIIYKNYNKGSLTIHRLEVVEQGGSVYELGRHRDILLEYGANGIIPVNSLTSVIEKNSVEIPPNK